MEVESVFRVDGADSFREAYFEPCAVGHEHLMNRSNEANNLEPSYQVIFATSNIANELNKPEYTVGDYYSQANKSLKHV